VLERVERARRNELRGARSAAEGSEQSR
jgi:hypothetical protein